MRILKALCGVWLALLLVGGVTAQPMRFEKIMLPVDTVYSEDLTHVFQLDIKAQELLKSPMPALVGLSGETNTETIFPARGFDASTEEFLVFTINLPADLDPNRNAVFTLWWTPNTAAEGDVVWKVYHLSRMHQESHDAAMTSFTFTSAAPTVQQEIRKAEHSVLVSTLGWQAGEVLLLYLSRDAAAGGDTLSDDALLIGLSLTVPAQ